MIQRKSFRVSVFLGSVVLFVLLIPVLVINTAGADGVVLPWDTPPKYRIAYLVGNEPMAQTNLVGSEKLAQTLGTRTARSWAQVKELDQRRSLDALVIHKNALSLVNKTELVNLYSRGVAIAVFNVDAFKTADLLNDPCISENDQGSRNYKGTFAIVATRFYLGAPEDVEKLKADAAACGQRMVEGVKGRTLQVVGHTTKAITNTSDYNIFAQEIVRVIELIRLNKANFAEQ